LKTKSVSVIGGGGHAKSVITILKKLDDFKLIGYTDIENKGEILGTKYLGKDTALFDLGVKNICIGISYLKTPFDQSVRKKIINIFSQRDFVFPSIVSRTSIINFEVEIGQGTIVFDRVVINSGSSLGDFGVINTGAVIEHDCKIGDHIFIAPGGVICGNVKIGNDVFIGAGSIVRDGVSIPDNVIIGSCSNVINDIEIPGLYLGNPARLIK